MNLVIVALTLFLVWRRGVWKNWVIFNSTMVYISMCNLLYDFLYCGHHLWHIKPDFVSDKINDMLLTFIVFPLTVLLLLSDYPKNIKGQVFRIAKFVIIYFSVELIYATFGKIEYNYGWNLLYSLIWLCVMFPMLILHNRKPLAAYFFSLLIMVIMLVLFPVNLTSI